MSASQISIAYSCEILKCRTSISSTRVCRKAERVASVTIAPSRPDTKCNEVSGFLPQNFFDESSKKNEERIAQRVRLMVPQIECADTHREIHRIEFIEPQRARKKTDCQTARKMSAALASVFGLSRSWRACRCSLGLWISLDACGFHKI